MCFFDWFDKPKTPKPPPPVAAPPPAPKPAEVTNTQTQVGQKVEAEKRKETDRVKQFKGAQSTLLTSPFGATEDANVKKKTLLGG